MPQEIWQEGRVVGLSAYEIYVKQHLSEYPDVPPATERQWLSASIGAGSSMLLQLPASSQTGAWMIDIPLPASSNLTAANVIFASFFDGDADFEDAGVFTDVWATKVTDYGYLILNNSMFPRTNTSADVSYNELPKGSDFNPSQDTLDQLLEYSKIIDGVILQPGEWTDTESTPAKDFTPDLTQVPVLRLSINGTISHRPKILLTGFTARYILSSTAGLEGSTDTVTPYDGDFLGPSVFPWGAKVVFTMPAIYQNYLGAKLSYSDLSYTSQMSGDAKAKIVTVSAEGNTAKLLSLSADGTSQYTMSADPSSTLYLNSDGKLTWSILAEALANNKKIDVTKNQGGTSIVVNSVSGGTGITVTPTTGDVVVNSNIAQGTGITVSHSSNPNKYTISNAGVTSVSGGSGISVSGSTGAVTISNTGVTSIAAGSGIGVSHSGTTWTIKNTMSEYTPISAWTTLEYGTDFTFANNTATTNYTGWLNGFALWDVTKSDEQTTLGPDQYPIIQVNHPSGANYADIRIVFAQGEGSRYRLGNKNLMPSPRQTFTGDQHCFRFSHHAEWDSSSSNWPYSVIAAIGFTTDGKKKLMGDDKYTEWADANIIEDPSNHLWEVAYYDGGYSNIVTGVPAKWGVATQIFKCNLTRRSDNSGESAGQHTDNDKIVVTAHDIFDGFNTQYGREDSQTTIDNWLSFSKPDLAITNILAVSRYLDTIVTMKLYWS